MEKLIVGYNNFISRWKSVRDVLFYVILTIELGLMLYERTDAPLTTPSYVFRATFVMTLMVIFMTEYTLRQWIVIVLTVIFTFCCYRITGNNDLLRFSMFVIACKDIDLDKAMKFILGLSLAGTLVTFCLALTGVYGNLLLTGEYGRSVGEESRYVFGFGHPNTAHGAYFSLVLLFVYVFRKMDVLKRLAGLILMLAGNFVLYHYTDSRTGMIMTSVAIIGGFFTLGGQKLRNSGILYVLGSITMAFSMGISVWAAAISPHAHDKKSIYKKIDKLLTGRIWTLYHDTRQHKGSIETWTLFGDANSGASFFDMGWVRFFYWYGIIPATVIAVLLFVLMYRIYLRRNLEVLVMMCAISVYTIVEAGFISSYIGRNFMLPVFGVYLLNSYNNKEAVPEACPFGTK